MVSAMTFDSLQHICMPLWVARDSAVKVASKFYRPFRGIIHRRKTIDKLLEVGIVVVANPISDGP